MNKILSAITYESAEFLEEYMNAGNHIERINIHTNRLLYDAMSSEVSAFLDEHPVWITLAKVEPTKYGFATKGPGLTINHYDVDNLPVLENGVIYGYPKCCREYFDKRCYSIAEGYPDDVDTSPRKVPLNGTGYVPCPKCRRESEQTLIDRINAARLLPTAFPNSDYATEYFLQQFLPTVGEPIGDNVIDNLKDEPECKHSLLAK